MHVVGYNPATGTRAWDDAVPGTASSTNTGVGIIAAADAVYAVGHVSSTLAIVKYVIAPLPVVRHYHAELQGTARWVVFTGATLVAPLAGRVLDDTGSAAADLPITISTDAACGSFGGQAGVTLRTDASGHFAAPAFRVTGTASATCSVIAQSTDVAPSSHH